MKTEDFYNPDKRREAEVSVREMLERELGEKHIKVIDVLIRSVCNPGTIRSPLKLFHVCTVHKRAGKPGDRTENNRNSTQ